MGERFQCDEERPSSSLWNVPSRAHFLGLWGPVELQSALGMLSSKETLPVRSKASRLPDKGFTLGQTAQGGSALRPSQMHLCLPSPPRPLAL